MIKPLFLIAVSVSLLAQDRSLGPKIPFTVTSLPGTCTPKAIFNLNTGGTSTLYTCNDSGTGFTIVGGSALPTTLKYASQLTSVVMDAAQASPGGAITGTDNSSTVNTFLATNSATNPIELIVDGPLGVGHAIQLNAAPYFTMRCVGNGAIYLLNGANSHILQNGIPLPFDPGTTAPARAGSVEIHNCTFYGNRGVYGTNGNSTLTSNGAITYTGGGPNEAMERGGLGGYTLGTLSGSLSSSATSFTISNAIPTTLPSTNNIVIDTEILTCTAYSGSTFSSCTRGAVVSGWSGQSGAVTHSSGAAAGTFTWYCGITLTNVATILLDHVHVYDSSTYGIKLNNFGVSNITNSQVEFSAVTNQSPNTDGFHFDGPWNDLHVSNSTCTLTGDDCLGFNCDEGYGGACTRTTVNNFTFDRAAVGTRIYGNAYQAGMFTYNNVSGTVRDRYMILGAGTSAIADGVQSVSVSNGWVQSEAGAMADLVQMATNTGSVVFENMRWIAPNSGAVAWFHDTTGTYSHSDTECINCALYQNTVASAAPPLFYLGGGTWKKAVVTNCSVSAETGQAPVIPAYLINNSSSGTLAQLVSNGNDGSCGSLVASNGFTGITQITGYGLTETGWGLPDSITKNGAIYLSSSQGSVPVVKSGGTSYPISSAPTLVSGAISGSVSVNTITTANLTSVGVTDWASFNTIGFLGSPYTASPNQRKATGGSKISTALMTTTNAVTDRTNQGAGSGPMTMSWTDGTPTSSGSSASEDWVTGGTSSIAFSVPASAVSHTVYVYALGYACPTATFTASLSDASATPYSDTSMSNAGQIYARYTIVFNAASSSQTLNMQAGCSGGNGSSIIALQGVALN